MTNREDIDKQTGEDIHKQTNRQEKTLTVSVAKRTYTIATLLEPKVEDVGPSGRHMHTNTKRKCVSILRLAEILKGNKTVGGVWAGVLTY